MNLEPLKNEKNDSQNEPNIKTVDGLKQLRELKNGESEKTCTSLVSAENSTPQNFSNFKSTLLKLNEKLYSEEKEADSVKLPASMQKSTVEKPMGKMPIAQSSITRTPMGQAPTEQEKIETFDCDIKEKQNDKYRAEFNEFKYARYAETVIGDLCKLSSRQITAALSVCACDKLYAYAVGTRGLSAVESYLKSVKKAKKSAYSSNSKVNGEKIGNDCLRIRKFEPPFKTCAVIGSALSDACFSVVLKEVAYARAHGASEIEVCVSREGLSLSDGRALKKEIKSLKRAAGKAFLKLGVRLSELNDLQAESFLSTASSLKIRAIVLYGDCAIVRLKRLKGFAPRCRFELKNPVANEKTLCKLLDCGADKIYSERYAELCVSLKKELKQ